MDIERWHRENLHSDFMKAMRRLTWIKVDGAVVDSLAVEFNAEAAGERHEFELSKTVLQSANELVNIGIPIEDGDLRSWIEQQIRDNSVEISNWILEGVRTTLDTRPRQFKRKWWFGDPQLIPYDPIPPIWIWTDTVQVLQTDETIVLKGCCVAAS